uniref:Uncharacterized protein n=1 Tax=Hemiselmis andersenii TaxID=464988 RepID=A0A6T8PJU4_HEMAN|mmetsp:Transcript_18242/g.42230  ORF Transcript_18242/g.42230 Transcript_18242/m.42230 type:complete len:272 (-) Transcript_18242:121-936(-)
MLGFKDLFNKATAAINSVQIDTALNIQTRPKSGASGPQDAVPGTDIVARYEKRWEEITANGSMLAAKVSEEDAKVTEISSRCEAELASWRRLHQELETLSAVSDSVGSLRNEMQDLCGQLQQLDAALDGHLEAREEKEMHRWKTELERDTTMFARGREREVAQLDKSLKADIAKKNRARLQAQAAQAALAEREAQEAARLKKKEELAAAAEAAKASADTPSVEQSSAQGTAEAAHGGAGERDGTEAESQSEIVDAEEGKEVEKVAEDGAHE